MTRPALRRLRGALLTLGAVLGVVCILSVAASLLLGIRPLVVQSGSMAPAIETGALAWARQVPATELAVGDVVMVDTADGSRVTHRIVGIEQQGSSAVLQLRGDANDVPDVERYPVEEAYRVFAVIPYGGHVVAWLSGPIGLFLLGMYAMGLLLVVLRRDDDDEQAPPTGGGERRSVWRRTRLGAVGAAALVAVGVASPTWAVFADTAGVTGTTLSTGALTTPTTSCTRTPGTAVPLVPAKVTITWTAATVPVAHGYVARIQESNTPLTIISSGGGRSVTLNADEFATLFGQTVTVEVRGTYATSWTTPAATQKVTISLLGANISCGTTAASLTSHVQPACVRNPNGSITLSWTNVDASYEYYWERRVAGSTVQALPSAGFPAAGTLGASVAQGQTVSLTLVSAANGTASWDLVVFGQVEGTTSPRSAPTLNQIGRQGSSGLFCSRQN